MNPNTLAKISLSSIVLLGMASTLSSIAHPGGIAVANPVFETTFPATAVFSEEGIAIRGTDPVAYFAEGRSS